MTTEDIIAARACPEMLDYLLKRRSVPVKNLSEPGPSHEQVETILRAAARVPDHGKLFPWYFIVLQGDARKQAGAMLRAAWLEKEPAAEEAKLQLESERFLRAPLVIGVVSRVRESKNPVWEQVLSAGAACQNLCLAANALGFGANWLTEWYAYNDTIRNGFGVGENDNIAGFIYIGTPSEKPAERDRPDLSEITTWWQPGTVLKQGANYGQKGVGLPALQLRLPRKDEH